MPRALYPEPLREGGREVRRVWNARWLSASSFIPFFLPRGWGGGGEVNSWRASRSSSSRVATQASTDVPRGKHTRSRSSRMREHAGLRRSSAATRAVSILFTDGWLFRVAGHGGQPAQSRRTRGSVGERIGVARRSKIESAETSRVF